MLAQAGRRYDCLEVGLDTGVCYNPLYNDLDPYAVAYAITLLNNLSLTRGLACGNHIIWGFNTSLASGAST